MKEQTFGNGKIIICDFYRLKLEDFADVYKDMSRSKLKHGTVLASRDGRLFFNSRWSLSKILAERFDVLAKQTRGTLVDMYDALEKRFPEIKDFDDWNNMDGSPEEKQDALTMLLIQIEIDRRQTEKEYYG